MPESCQVSIIVVNHNRGDLLRHCLLSLKQQTFRSHEILVVDNGSSDHSRQVVQSFSGARIRLIELAENSGYGAGNNRGISQARGELVALINNDAVAHPRWLEALMEVVENSPERVGMWASRILFLNTQIIDKAGHLIYFDGQNRGRGTGERDRGQYGRVEEALFPDGCAALYRRELLEEVGGFDEEFFAYGDDADLGLRGRWMGWQCLYVPEALVYHQHSSTSGRFSPQKIFWIERNRLWLTVKTFPLILLLASPVFTLNRWIWNLVAALVRKGPAGEFRRDSSLADLAWAVARAYGNGLLRLAPMIRKRVRIRGKRRIGSLEFYRILFRFRTSARVLAFREFSSRR